MSSDLIDAVAACGLHGSRLQPPRVPATAEKWDALCARVEQERIAGFLATAIHDGAWPATAEQRDQATEMHTAAAVTALLLERQLLEVADLFEGAGVQYRVLKGPAHAHLLYPEPTVRSFGDLDLLVPSPQIEAAIQLLTEGGGERRFAEPRPGFDRKFSKGACIRLPNGWEVDLHRTFVAGPFGLTIDLHRLFERSDSFVLGGKTLPALAPEERLLDACYHAVLAHRPPRLVALRDIAQMANDESGDSDLVCELARSWKGEVVLSHALAVAWDRLGLTHSTPLTRWAAQHSANRSARRRLNVYTGARRSYAGQAIAALRVIPGFRDKVAYGLAIALPKRAPDRAPAVTRWRRGARVLLRLPRT